jgi:hypothetical protein
VTRIAITKRERFSLLGLRRVFDLPPRHVVPRDVRWVFTKVEQRMNDKERAELASFGERFVYVPDHGDQVLRRQVGLDRCDPGVSEGPATLRRAMFPQESVFQSEELTAEALASIASSLWGTAPTVETALFTSRPSPLRSNDRGERLAR